MLVMKDIQKALESHLHEEKHKVESVSTLFPPEYMLFFFFQENNAVLLNSFSNE